jgi:hypothetical protein
MDEYHRPTNLEAPKDELTFRKSLPKGLRALSAGREALDRTDGDAQTGDDGFLAPRRKMSQKGALQLRDTPSPWS